jgi:hypothetical protein
VVLVVVHTRREEERGRSTGRVERGVEVVDEQ